MLREQRLHGVYIASNLIKECGLSIENNVDYTVGIFDKDELVATGSLTGDMIKMLAVAPDYQGEDLSAVVITHLVKYSMEKGISNLHLYTKPDNIHMFSPLGFKVVAVARPYAALLEWGRPGIAEYCDDIREKAGNIGEKASAIVMNCNPFTLGHRYLIETAASQSDRVYIFVVEEDLSVFPFNVRFRLIKEGTAYLPNVTVIPGGRYVVSSLTFPSYFTRETELAYAHTAIDVEIFLRHIAPTLNINRRYIGTEPFSPVTDIYNNAMKERLIPAGIEVSEIARLEKGAAAISASRVRESLSKGDMDSVMELVPNTTFEYLMSKEALPVLKKLLAI